MKGSKKVAAFQAAKKLGEEDIKDKAVQKIKESNSSEEPYKTKESAKESAGKGAYTSKALAGIEMKNGVPVGLEGSIRAGKSNPRRNYIGCRYPEIGGYARLTQREIPIWTSI